MAVDNRTDIANLALLHLGQGVEISNLSNERTAQALAIRPIFDLQIEATLRDFAWPFATAYATLGLVTEYGDAGHISVEWTYSYRMPSDCVMPRKIQSGIRNDNRQSLVVFKQAQDSSGLLILTDQEDAVLEYTKRVSSIEFWPPDFKLAVSLRIAMYAAPKLTAQDPFGMRKSCADLYSLELSKARANAYNGEQEEDTPDSELIRART